jgi:hypothetical protein
MSLAKCNPPLTLVSCFAEFMVGFVGHLRIMPLTYSRLLTLPHNSAQLQKFVKDHFLCFHAKCFDKTRLLDLLPAIEKGRLGTLFGVGRKQLPLNFDKLSHHTFGHKVKTAYISPRPRICRLLPYCLKPLLQSNVRHVVRSP